MNNMVRILGAITILALPLAAIAQPPSYSHLDVGYTIVQPDEFGTLNGFGIGGSAPFTDRIHGTVAYGNVDNDTHRSSMYFGTLGYHLPLGTSTDVVLRAGWAWQTDRRTGSTKRDGQGHIVLLGVRHMLTSELELGGWVGHHDTTDSRMTGSIEAIFHFAQNLGLFGAVDVGDDDNAIRLGMRFGFEGF